MLVSTACSSLLVKVADWLAWLSFDFRCQQTKIRIDVTAVHVNFPEERQTREHPELWT
jgi:hypothetical protein